MACRAPPQTATPPAQPKVHGRDRKQPRDQTCVGRERRRRRLLLGPSVLEALPLALISCCMIEECACVCWFVGRWMLAEKAAPRKGRKVPTTSLEGKKHREEAQRGKDRREVTEDATKEATTTERTAADRRCWYFPACARPPRPTRTLRLLNERLCLLMLLLRCRLRPATLK